MILRNYLTLLAIGLIWGSQFIFQEVALGSFAPVWIGACRALLGAVTLIVICKTLGINGNSNQWGLFALIGLLEAVIPFVLIPWGQQNLTSSITAILMGTLPFYALLLAPLFIRGARISAGNTSSVFVGFCCLLVLFYPDLVLDRGELNMLSAAAVIVAAICFAIALLLLNRVHDEHPLIVARNVLSMASVQLLVVALFSAPLTFGVTSAGAILSLVYLGVMCAGVVYYLYMMSIRHAGAVFTSMTNYLVPAVGVLIGVVISDEPVQANTWIALSIILFALFINQKLSAPQSQR